MRPPFQVNLHCHNVGKMFNYFTKVLDFQPDFRVRDERGDHVYAGVTFVSGTNRVPIVLGGVEEALRGSYDHGEFGKALEDHPLGTGVVLYFYLPNVDRYYQEIVKRGAMIDEPPTDQFWGNRTISVLTPDNYYLTFATPIKGFRFPPAFDERMETFKRPRSHMKRITRRTLVGRRRGPR